ncbi:MAG: cytochrome b5 domain-containing protein [Candidatus Paceibacterota bacterium]|jgi:cytochrome b involved in lipid metabolism
MKKLVGVSLFVFWAFVAAILTAGLVFYQNNKNSPAGNSVLPSGASDPVQEEQITLDAAEIAKHGSTQDCWLLINSKVYNVTTYLGTHAGGVATIAPYCGKEATQAFATKETGSSHSSYANELLASYYVGDLNQKIGAPQPGQNTQNANTPPPPQPNPSAADPAPKPPPPPVSQTSLNAAEIAKHNSTGDCWIIISSKVYNVTSYLQAHPGGVGTISPYCGQDATQAFQGKGHSSYADSLLASYYIGSLNQTVDTPVIQQNVQNTNNTPPPINIRGDDDDDNDD